MGQYTLTVDPYAINKASVQSVIDSFMARPGAETMMNFTYKPGTGTIFVTDNTTSPNFVEGNLALLKKLELQASMQGGDLRGFSQDVGKPMIYVKKEEKNNMKRNDKNKGQGWH